MKKNALLKKLQKNYDLLLIFALPLAWYIIFMYVPMYGLQIAFKDYTPGMSIWAGDWVGFKYLNQFFDSYYFKDLLLNTILLSLGTILIGFPIPIIFALLLNEIRNKKFQKLIQNVTYIPYFLSAVVIVSMLSIFSDPQSGIFNMIRQFFGLEAIDLLSKPEYFRSLYIFSDVWQFMGFNAVIYIAALSAIDPSLYEAADIDGATRLQKIIHISLPEIKSTILILFILRIGSTMTIGFEKVYLMQNPVNLETSEIISTFIYKYGLIKGQYSYSAAMGLFNNAINFVLLVVANTLSKKLTKHSLW